MPRGSGPVADGLAEIAPCRETYVAADTTIIKKGDINADNGKPPSSCSD